MNSIRLSAILILAALSLAGASLTQAQATRTWVSGVGDDANPCSRTAPCKTFAGAISKTADAGEISVLDPGGYGAVTITKSITIDGGQGAGFGSILNAASSAVIINAAADDVVILRNLSINGAGVAPSTGIRILQAKKVYVENVVVSGNAGADPSGRGISDTRTGGGQLYVADSIIRNNSQTGIVVLPASGSTTIDVSVRNTQIAGNGNCGIVAIAGAHINIFNSHVAGHPIYGLYLDESAGDTQVSVTDSTITDNVTGIYMGGGNPTLVLSGVLVTDNDTGMVRGTGPVLTFSNNRIAGNLTGNGPFSPAFTAVAPQ